MRSTTVLLFVFSLMFHSGASADSFNLTVLHTNDTHSHHEPQSRSGAGGIARQATVVKALREKIPNTVLVDAGDRFTGTLYHKYYQGEDTVRVMNHLGYDILALGNHEFDNGLEVLDKLTRGVEFPVLAANVEFPETSPLRDRVSGSSVLQIGGESVAFIGLVTAETPEITINFPGKEQMVWRGDYAAIVNAEVTRLESQGINKIFLVTHLGFGVDLDLARQTRGVDAIIGGHSHIALSNTYKEAGKNPYPVITENSAGEPVYVVQAGDQDRYLGQLNLTFDEAGNVMRARGDLIYLSAFISPDTETQALLSELSEPINLLKNTPVEGAPGDVVVSETHLSNQGCRHAECPLGNLISDAMLAETGAQIALQNGGGIRADIDEGEVTVGEVLTVLPFGNTVATFKLTGANVLTALENGLSRIGASSGTGRFAQVSGIRLQYDPTKPAGARVVSVSVGSGENFQPLDPDAIYSVATNNFMRTGGDGYTVFAEFAINAYDFGRPLEEVLIDYMIANKPLNRDTDGRIESTQ